MTSLEDHCTISTTQGEACLLDMSCTLRLVDPFRPFCYLHYSFRIILVFSCFGLVQINWVENAACLIPRNLAGCSDQGWRARPSSSFTLSQGVSFSVDSELIVILLYLETQAESEHVAQEEIKDH